MVRALGWAAALAGRMAPQAGQMTLQVGWVEPLAVLAPPQAEGGHNWVAG